MGELLNPIKVSTRLRASLRKFRNSKTPPRKIAANEISNGLDQCAGPSPKHQISVPATRKTIPPLEWEKKTNAVTHIARQIAAAPAASQRPRLRATPRIPRATMLPVIKKVDVWFVFGKKPKVGSESKG